MATLKLSDVVSRRAEVCAGVYLAITRRCPLSCAHCSTRSAPDSEQLSATPYLDFVKSMTCQDRPDFVWLTGGEPLLRPRLVQQVADECDRVGARLLLATGLFFARYPRIPRAVLSAMSRAALVTASLDEFHEVEVPRTQALRALQELADNGVSLGIQITARAHEDPFAQGLLGDLRSKIDPAPEVYVDLLSPVGRGLDLVDLPERRMGTAARPMPCSYASWPVVSFDGHIVTCCNEDVVDGPRPQHLEFGRAGFTTWPDVRKQMTSRPALRVIRTLGPRVLAQSLAGQEVTNDYCGACRGLDAYSDLDSSALATVETPSFQRIEAGVQRLQQTGPEYLRRVANES